MDNLDFAPDSIEIDPVSQVIVERFETPFDDTQQLKFKLNPGAFSGIAFAGKQIEETRIAGYRDSSAYTEFVNKCFEVYEDLGEDRMFSLPTIGLINHSSKSKQDENLQTALEALVTELELLIMNSEDIYDLEDCLNILNCLKLVYFDGSSVTAQLINWVNRADGKPTPEHIEEVFAQEKPYLSEHLWKLVSQQCLRGLFPQAVNTIQQSGYEELQKSCPETYNVLVDLCQMLANYSHDNDEVFRSWKSTLSDMGATYYSQQVSSPIKPNIDALLSLLSGSQKAIVDASSTWYECLVGMTLFYIPTRELLSDYLDVALDTLPQDDNNVWERCCIDIIRGEIMSIFPNIESLDTATACFTSVLCAAKGLLLNDMSSYLCHSFALSCLSIHNLVSVGVGLLSYSQEPGARIAIAEFLCSYEFQTNDDIEWALSVCAKLKLADTARTLYRVAGQRSLFDGKLLDALACFSKAGEVQWCVAQCWLVFENALLKSGIVEDPVINAIVDGDTLPQELIYSVTPVIRQSLSPYAVLFDYFFLVEENQLAEALEKLCTLLTFPHLPTKYYPLLLNNLYNVFLKETLPFGLFDNNVCDILSSIGKFEKSMSEVSEESDALLMLVDESLTTESLLHKVRSSLSTQLSFCVTI